MIREPPGASCGLLGTSGGLLGPLLDLLWPPGTPSWISNMWSSGPPKMGGGAAEQEKTTNRHSMCIHLTPSDGRFVPPPSSRPSRSSWAVGLSSPPRGPSLAEGCVKCSLLDVRVRTPRGPLSPPSAWYGACSPLIFRVVAACWWIPRALVGTGRTRATPESRAMPFVSHVSCGAELTDVRGQPHCTP